MMPHILLQISDDYSPAYQGVMVSKSRFTSYYCNSKVTIDTCDNLVEMMTDVVSGPYL